MLYALAIVEDYVSACMAFSAGPLSQAKAILSDARWWLVDEGSVVGYVFVF